MVFIRPGVYHDYFQCDTCGYEAKQVDMIQIMLG